jgi:hypothetical protein
MILSSTDVIYDEKLRMIEEDKNRLCPSSKVYIERGDARKTLGEGLGWHLTRICLIVPESQLSRRLVWYSNIVK